MPKVLFLSGGAAILLFLIYKTIWVTQQSAWEACMLSIEAELVNSVHSSDTMRSKLRLERHWRTLTLDERQSLIQFVLTSNRLDCPGLRSKESLIEFLRVKEMWAREADGRIEVQIE